MIERLKFWNQYGYQPDVFRQYGEAVRRSNQGTLQVVSMIAVIGSIVTACFGLATHQVHGGIYFCLGMLAAGIAAAFCAFSEKPSERSLLITGYLLGAAVYAMSIWAAISYDTDVFWIGVSLLVGGYLFDYAWRIGLLQIVSYVALEISWQAQGIRQESVHSAFTALYLVISLIMLYTLNRSRALLITSREESQHAADTDQLTGLMARAAAQQEIEKHLKTDEHGVMMLLDLDGFKSVNDKLGHQMGDKVLIEVATDMKTMFRNSDVLSRLGGDEFVIYLKSVPGKEWVLERSEQMVQKICRVVGSGADGIRVAASVGIVMTDMVGRTYDDLYRAADIAMYTAKNAGGNKALFYTDEMRKIREAAGSTRPETAEPARGSGSDNGLRQQEKKKT